MIKLPNVIYDIRARDGTWCRLPYPNHPKGCPNFPRCPSERPDFRDLNFKQWKAVIVEFDLKRYKELRREKYPNATDRQLGNLLYWQGRVRSALWKKANSILTLGGMILDIPEASGVNIFETMILVGIKIERHPNIVRKVMLVGMMSDLDTL